MADHQDPVLEGITPGVYEHYKGDLYQVFGTVFHTEDQVEMVHYTNATGIGFVRPRSMFLSDVEYKGKIVPRFKFVQA